VTDNPNDPGDSAEGPLDPISAMFGAADPAQLGAAFQRLGQLLSYEGGPVNWELAHEVARQVVAAGGDRSVLSSESVAVAEAVRLAELWLDPVTTLPAGATQAMAWSRAEWVEATLPAWQELIAPLADRVVAAMGEAMPGQLPQMAAPLLGVFQRLGGAMFGGQVGQAIGALAAEVVSSTDIGLPLGPARRAALLPENMAAFGAGLEVPDDQVRLFLALREAAYHRLFRHAPWLRARLFHAIEAYAAEIKIDTSRIEEAIGQLDPTNAEALTAALSSGMFEPEQSPEQTATLARLETLLALAEGWVDEVSATAAAPHLPSASALRETIRRRRAAGGPAEATFASLVGLELRPRRLREAAALWRQLAEQRGIEGRDAIWEHPDLLPDADDLDDPSGYLHRTEIDLAVPDLASLPGPTEAGTGGAQTTADVDQPGTPEDQAGTAEDQPGPSGDQPDNDEGSPDGRSTPGL
jgi:putative hydrolase